MALTKSKISTSWTCCSLRRRTVTNKLITILIQVIVVIVVWHVVKRNDTGAECDEVKLRRDLEESIPICKPDEYTKGTGLQLDDLVSASTELDSDEGYQIKEVLKVDIFVRDIDSGNLVLYPKGTPFALKSDSTSEKDVDSMSEFYYDNSVEEQDLEKIEDETDTKNTSSSENQTDRRDIAIEMDQSDNMRAMNARANSVDNQVKKSFMNQNSIIVNDEAEVLQSSRDVVKDNNQMMLTSQQMKENQLNLAADQSVTTRNQNGVRSYPSDVQSLSVQNVDAMQGQVVQMASDQQQYPDIQQQSVEVPYSQHKTDSGPMPEHIIMTTTPQSERYYDTNEVDLAGGARATLYAEGFRERIKTFKSEFYGQSLESQAHLLDAQYVMNNPTICENIENIDLLFLIHSLPQSDEQRQRIRTTFVQTELFKPFTLVHVFLVGKTNSPNFQTNLNADAERYGDIVQGDFTDKAETRTQKGLMGLRWTVTFCPTAKNVLKIDEDVFVDTEKLLKGLIPTMNQVIGKRAMLCFFSQDAPIPRSGPNAVSPNLFPNSSKLRPFCKGFAVLMTPATVSSLLAASKHVPLCPLDDMFLYGVLPFIAGGIEVYDLGNKRAFHDFGMAVVTCYQDLQDRCQYVITKAFSTRFTSLWEIMKAGLESGSERIFMGQSLWDIGSWRKQF